MAKKKPERTYIDPAQNASAARSYRQTSKEAARLGMNKTAVKASKLSAKAKIAAQIHHNKSMSEAEYLRKYGKKR